MNDECTCCGAKVEYASTLTFKRYKVVTLKDYMQGKRQTRMRRLRAQDVEGFDGLCDDCVARVVETIRTMQASIRPWVGKM